MEKGTQEVTDRYDTTDNSEGQFQPDSNEKVLLNKLGITKSAEMDDVELDLLEQLTEMILGEIEIDQTITSDDLCEWHRRWLGNVYDWAGQYRLVNMGKDDFQFAAAHLIPKLMQAFNEKFLSVYTACDGMDENQLIDALAIVHIEYILVHPFREGNGRLSRLLANIMALQAGQPVLDFTFMDDHKNEYFVAVQAGLDDAEPMKEMFRQVLYASQKSVKD